VFKLLAGYLFVWRILAFLEGGIFQKLPKHNRADQLIKTIRCSDPRTVIGFRTWAHKRGEEVKSGILGRDFPSCPPDLLRIGG
jgi:hypothetical protein